MLVAPERHAARRLRGRARRAGKRDEETPRGHALPQTEEAGLYFARTRPGRPVDRPAHTGVDEFHAPDVAKMLREKLGLDDGPPLRGGQAAPRSAQGALWAGMVDLTKEDLESAERVGFPVVLLILLAVFGSLAAAALPLVIGRRRGAASPAG